MPADLNIVVLKAADADNADTTDRNARQLQFSKEFTIRKDIVLRQLYFLKVYYLGYYDVQIDNTVDLLHNSNVINNVTSGRYDNTGPGRDGLSNQRPRT